MEKVGGKPSRTRTPTGCGSYTVGIRETDGGAARGRAAAGIAPASAASGRRSARPRPLRLALRPCSHRGKVSARSASPRPAPGILRPRRHPARRRRRRQIRPRRPRRAETSPRGGIPCPRPRPSGRVIEASRPLSARFRPLPPFPFELPRRRQALVSASAPAPVSPSGPRAVWLGVSGLRGFPSSTRPRRQDGPARNATDTPPAVSSPPTVCRQRPAVPRASDSTP